MRAAGLLLLTCAVFAAGDVVKVYAEDEPVLEETSAAEDFQEPATAFIVDQESNGGLRVTGMLQSFRMDGADGGSFNQLLSRPRASFLDLSWGNWVEQRLEVLDLFQNLLSPVPRCSHMRTESGSLDSGMVSYLASSRFGPAILTTYAQRFQDDEEDEFDYNQVYIADGESLGKSYEEASLLEDLSEDADKAFQLQESRVLSQQNDGFFGANIKTPQDEAMYSAQLDGHSESVQPNIRAEPPLKITTFENFVPEQSSTAEYFGDEAVRDTHQIAGFALFIFLCLGCIYVWFSLIISCCRMGKELRAKRRSEKAAAQKQAQQELLVPLMPEGAKQMPDVQIAASHAPSGTYYAPRGAEYVTVAVPLANGLQQA